MIVFKTALNFVFDITIQSPRADQNKGKSIIAITIFSNIVKFKKLARYIIIRYAIAKEPKIEHDSLITPRLLLLSL